MAGAQQDWTWLLERLRRGDDCDSQVRDFLRAGGGPSDIVSATLGNRDAGAKSCPKSLRLLLEARADANFVVPGIDSPLIHLAAWNSTTDIVELLLKHRADMEMGEAGEPTPPLNTALAAGNAPVALMLLNRRANAQWKHKDGATALHVATAWISDTERAQRRLPPLGEEPRAIVAGLLHNGVDPTQREGFSGLSPLDAFRSSMKTSPWLNDENVGPQFKQTSDRVFSLMLAADEAMKHKARGNKALGEKNYKDALQSYVSARSSLEKEGIAGHHMAVLWSNEAICCKKAGDMERCRAACEAGLGNFCWQGVRAKLENHLAECKAAPSAAAAAGSDERVVAKEESADKTAFRPPDRPTEAQLDSQPEKEGETQDHQSASAKKKPATKLKQGFFSGAKEFYGPEGSVQGKNHSDLVDAPFQGRTVKVPYGKVLPVEVPNPHLEEKEDSD